MKIFAHIVFILISWMVYSQKPLVSLTCDVKSVQIGDQLTFTVKSNVPGEVNIDFPKEFNPGYGTMNGMEQEMDYQTGAITTIYYFSQNGSFRSNGSFTFYAYVSSPKKVYRSNSITIKVEKQAGIGLGADEEITRRNLKQPVFGVIQRSKVKVYEGEPVVLEAKTYSKLNINMLEEYDSFEIEGGAESKEIDKSQRLLISKTTLKGQNYLTFTTGKVVVFPSEIGKVRIKPFKMIFQYDNGGIFSERISFVSNPSYLEIMPLPPGAPKNFIGAVGEFDLDCQLSKTTAKQGEVVKLIITVSGAGNLHNIQPPTVKLPKNILLYGDPDIKEEYVFGAEGAEGKIIYSYHLQLKGSGDEIIPPISIAYFNPEQKKYIQVRKKEFRLEVLPAGQLPAASLNPPVIKKDTTSNEHIPLFAHASENNGVAFYHSVLFWPSVISPFIFAFVGVLFFSTKKEKQEKNREHLSRKKHISEIKQLLEQIKKSEAVSQNERISEIESFLKSWGRLYQDQPCTKGELIDLMSRQQVPEQQIDALKQLFVACEKVRYSFDDASDQIREIMEESEKLFHEII